MSATRSAVKKTVPVDRSTSQLVPFVWEGTDKRGKKMKGEQTAKNANLLKAELRRQVWVQVAQLHGRLHIAVRSGFTFSIEQGGHLVREQHHRQGGRHQGVG